MRRVNRDVGLNLLDSDFGEVARVVLLATLFHRKREIDAVDFLVGAEVHDGLIHFAANKLHLLRSDLEVRVRVQVIVNDVAVGQRDLQPVDVVAVYGVVPQVLDTVVFGGVIH